LNSLFVEYPFACGAPKNGASITHKQLRNVI